MIASGSLKNIGEKDIMEMKVLYEAPFPEQGRLGRLGNPLQFILRIQTRHPHGPDRYKPGEL